ncbi:MAG: ABC transporter substrate-binding protein, partial [bacterium]|nr:ABC transporter substrate-binding protein [bacterium]
MLKKTISRIVLIVFFMAAKQSYACELNRPVKFAGLDWDSAQFVMEIARVIIEKGYGCPTEALPGSTLPMLSGLIRGDIDVLPEVWKENIKEAWHKAEKSGAVKTLGIAFRGAKQGFYVPKYVIDGDKSRNIKPMAPNLKSVYDLHKYSQVFKDREEPSKGRFYNCIIGWSCEKVNNQKLKAYSLDNYYNNFHPGTSASLSAAIESAYLQGEPILFYYWEPTWIMGKYDLYKLKEPAYTHEKWKTLETESKQFPEGCAYPLVDVYTGASTNFIKEAPELVAFLGKFELTSKLISKYLAFIKENEAGHREAALQFLKNEKKLWHTWVPEKVAENINLKETKA